MSMVEVAIATNVKIRTPSPSVRLTAERVVDWDLLLEPPAKLNTGKGCRAPLL